MGGPLLTRTITQWESMDGLSNPTFFKQVNRLAITAPGNTDFPSPVSALAFDNTQELLWVGNNSVRPRRILPPYCRLAC